LKKFLAVGAALVLASATARAAPPPVFDWTGFYLGGHLGSAVTHGQLSNLPPGGFIVAVPTPSIDFRADGFLGGGQLGYNWQWMNWVAGVEADISASHLHSSGPFNIVSGPFPVFGSATAGSAESRNDLFTTARGRLGYAAGNLLFYGTGGFAWARERLSTVGTAQFCFIGCSPLIPFATSDTRWVAGWTGGGGIDWAFAPNWFVRIEYLRLEFGKHNFTVDPSLSGTPLPLASHADIVRFGLNYKFGH
jgi:outer membrane immunogenic protein